MPETIQTLVIVGVLLLAGVLASKLSSRLGVPALLAFLLLGMLVGEDGLGVSFDDPHIAQLVAIVALSYILFDGGLHAHVGSIDRKVLRSGLLLSTVGVGLTALLVAAFAVFALGLQPVYGLLLGAIVSSTDAAAVFSVLRAKDVGLPKRLRTLLEFESGSNDPMAVFLTVSALMVLQRAIGAGELAVFFLTQMVGGALIGFAAGLALVWLINHIDLEYDGLYPVLTLSSVPLLYGASEWVGANGFLAVYVMGLLAGARVLRHKRSLSHFHQGLGWLMQITMFLILGLLVTPSDVVGAAIPGAAVALFLIFIARPFSVMPVLIASPLPWRERNMVAWVGLRGAAPIVLATFPLVAGVEGAHDLFNMVFFAVVLSVLLQGPSVAQAARLLRVATPVRSVLPSPVEFEPPPGSDMLLRRITVPERSSMAGRKLMEAGEFEDMRVVILARADKLLIPTGGTVLQEGDTLFALGTEDSVEEFASGVRRVEGGRSTHSD